MILCTVSMNCWCPECHHECWMEIAVKTLWYHMSRSSAVLWNYTTMRASLKKKTIELFILHMIYLTKSSNHQIRSWLNFFIKDEGMSTSNALNLVIALWFCWLTKVPSCCLFFWSRQHWSYTPAVETHIFAMEAMLLQVLWWVRGSSSTL